MKTITLYGYTVTEIRPDWFVLGTAWLGQTCDLREDGKVILKSSGFDKMEMARMAHGGWSYQGMKTWKYIHEAGQPLADYLARRGVMFHRSVGQRLRRGEQSILSASLVGTH